jgi:hypothetical protein
MVRSSTDRSTSFYLGLVTWGCIATGLVIVDLGVLAFFGSVVLALWQFGLRDKFDGETTASAYSVFNKGGKSLPGSTTIQDVDRELRGGGGIAADYDTTTTPSGPAEIKMTAGGRGFFQATTTSQEERSRRRKAAADAALRRNKITNQHGD